MKIKPTAANQLKRLAIARELADLAESVRDASDGLSKFTGCKDAVALSNQLLVTSILICRVAESVLDS